MAPNVKCILMLCLFSISYMPDVWFCGLKCGVVDIVLELQQSKTPIYISWVACYFYVHLSLFGLTCMYCCECIHCIYVLICTDCWMYSLYLCIDLYWFLLNITGNFSWNWKLESIILLFKLSPYMVNHGEIESRSLVV